MNSHSIPCIKAFEFSCFCQSYSCCIYFYPDNFQLQLVFSDSSLKILALNCCTCCLLCSALHTCQLDCWQPSYPVLATIWFFLRVISSYVMNFILPAVTKSATKFKNWAIFTIDASQKLFDTACLDLILHVPSLPSLWTFVQILFLLPTMSFLFPFSSTIPAFPLKFLWLIVVSISIIVVQIACISVCIWDQSTQIWTVAGFLSKLATLLVLFLKVEILKSNISLCILIIFKLLSKCFLNLIEAVQFIY